MWGLGGSISLSMLRREKHWGLPGGSEELFAKLYAYASVKGADNRISKWYLDLTNNMDETRSECTQYMTCKPVQ